jgi:S-(hydroxymethyl)glutathione dehydrogenase/alcohol dehydrogenase
LDRLTVEELETPTPRAGEVRIKVSACGVCHTDLHVIKGEVRFPLPGVLGHEVSGVIDAVGPSVQGWEVGAKVVASFIMPCGRCVACAQGRDDLCHTFFEMNRLKGTLYDGESRLRRKDGSALTMYSMAGLAEYAIVPVTDVFAAPGNVPLEDACILGCAVMTAYGAVKHQALLRPSQSLAVIGLGGVGSNVVQLARAFGAGEVIAIDVRDDKLQAARALGATQAINARTADPVAQVMALTRDQGVDVAVEALGRPETVTQAFRMTRDGGRAVVIGIADGQATAPIEITRLVRRGITLCGSYGCRVRTDLPELIRMTEAGQIKVTEPISRRYALDQVDEAYQALNRGEIVGRAIICMGG